MKNDKLAGVPRGSVLGTFLFQICANDLSEGVTPFKIFHVVRSLLGDSFRRYTNVFEKLTFLTQTCMWVRKVSFSENFADVLNELSLSLKP